MKDKMKTLFDYIKNVCESDLDRIIKYETAFERAVLLVRRAASKAYYLLESDALNEQDKADYRKLLDDNMTEAVLGDSLRVLSEMLEKHHNTKVILLIDEYDVPLAKAHTNGYYDQMISLIRNLLGEVLKQCHLVKSREANLTFDIGRDHFYD